MAGVNVTGRQRPKPYNAAWDCWKGCSTIAPGARPNGLWTPKAGLAVRCGACQPPFFRSFQSGQFGDNQVISEVQLLLFNQPCVPVLPDP